MQRALFDILVLVSIFMLPWWGACLIVFVLLWHIRNYYEAALFGLLLDALYIVPTGQAISFGFPFTFAFVALLLLFSYLKERMRFV